MNEINNFYKSRIDLRTLKIRRDKDPKKTFLGGLIIGGVIVQLLNILL